MHPFTEVDTNVSSKIEEQESGILSSGVDVNENNPGYTTTFQPSDSIPPPPSSSPIEIIEPSFGSRITNTGNNPTSYNPSYGYNQNNTPHFGPATRNYYEENKWSLVPASSGTQDTVVDYSSGQSRSTPNERDHIQSCLTLPLRLRRSDEYV